MQPGVTSVLARLSARRDSDHGVRHSNSDRSLFIECALITYHLPTSLHSLYKRMISCFTPDIESVISSPLDRVSMSTWMASASSRSWFAIAVLHFSTRLTTRWWIGNAPLVSSPSCTTTGVDNDSQFSASNKGFIRRSRSSTRRR